MTKRTLKPEHTLSLAKALAEAKQLLASLNAAQKEQEHE